MFFTVKTSTYYKDADKYTLLKMAKIIIYTYPMGQSENYLDTKLKTQYGIGLKDTCFNLLNTCKINFNGSDELVILWPAVKQDKLAQLITYGDGLVPGSKILQQAFKA